MPYTDSAQLAADASFQGRVRAAATQKALGQLAAAHDPSVRFQKRSELARRVLGEAETVVVGGSQTAPTVRQPTVVQQFAWALVANNQSWSLASPPTDTQLGNAFTTALIDAVAGVTANE